MTSDAVFWSIPVNLAEAHAKALSRYCLQYVQIKGSSPLSYSMSNWLEHTVQIEIDAPIDLVWSLWSDLEQMPSWMKWIDSVKIQEHDPKLSRWKLATGGLEFSWLSREVKVVPHQILQWESVDGLPNRGAIRFYDRGEAGSIVKMSVAYSVPGFLFQLMDNLFIGRVVESTLYADLERFRAYALKAKSAQGQPSNES